MPDEVQRAQIWQAMIPSAAAIARGVEFAELARTFVMSGGYIKNAVLRAAYLAADKGSAIDMECFWRAARSEYEAMGKLAVERLSS
jgi:hypothetical protein